MAQVDAARREQTRARYRDGEGCVERDGIRVFYEVYGSGEPTVLLLPTWSLIHSRFWKMQIPYLSRHARVVTFDGRGNGRSDRPPDPDAYDEREFAADAIAVMDETGVEEAAIVSLSLGAQRALIFAAEHSERVTSAVIVSPSLPIAPGPDYREVYPFDEALDTDEGRDPARALYRPLPGRDRAAGALCTRSLPRARDPRRRGCDQPPRAWGGARGGDGRRAGHDGRRRALPARPRSGRGQSACTRLRPRRGACAGLGARQVATEASSLRLVADRGRPCPARRRDRRRAAPAASESRDRLARPTSRDHRARGTR